MSDNTVLDFYEPFGFYETETEDGCTALLYETLNNGDYALVTDGDGIIPEDLEQEIIFAYYTADGAFSWSVSFEDSHHFFELLGKHTESNHLIDIVKQYRDSGDYY
ncbi:MULTISPECIES: hypothetical protein [Pelosinus]|uniref:Uncharacterized protein n=1 Tax=Pelosinus fermentans B4 TaxID=1149862 RepID=I8RDT2_9FIRM|nr:MULTISPECIES: hypothetical protein [Pelosinus]EIW17418.1 hypothetical protein FB4_4167 [Pelosinus fermentans B4]EIW23477.1 hypothetical protein FA11_4169 [Pelosinus fermentans A11]OAM96576.1 hypothetical protein FR7_04600 [Pelosinus fermentans DSM 17108]SDR41515.1 hypothetical protein SAMN04515679_4791 [Pelosinus fermentans]